MGATILCQGQTRSTNSFIQRNDIKEVYSDKSLHKRILTTTLQAQLSQIVHMLSRLRRDAVLSLGLKLRDHGVRSFSSITLPDTSYSPSKYDGPSKAEVLALRKQYLNPGACVSTSSTALHCTWKTLDGSLTPLQTCCSYFLSLQRSSHDCGWAHAVSFR